MAGKRIPEHKVRSGECTVCGMPQHALTTHCPGYFLAGAHVAQVMGGGTDFKAGSWIIGTLDTPLYRSGLTNRIYPGISPRVTESPRDSLWKRFRESVRCPSVGKGMGGTR